jgi:DNA gyrase subunit A
MGDQIMLVTSTGQSIRVPVEGISFRSRGAGGVKVFDTAKDETVASVAWIADQGDEEDAEET